MKKNERQREKYYEALNVIDNNIRRCIENFQYLSAGDMDQIDPEEWWRIINISNILAETLEANTYIEED